MVSDITRIKMRSYVQFEHLAKCFTDRKREIDLMIQRPC